MLTIYHVKGTRSARVIWLCEELKLPYEVETISFNDEFRSSHEWRKMNPVGKVPVMTDDDLTMFESGAMVQYILDKYGNGRLQPESSSHVYGLFLQWSWFAEATFARPIGEIVNHKRVFQETEQSNLVLEEMKNRTKLCLKALDEAIFDKEFILGSMFTSADIMLGYTMHILDKNTPSNVYNNAYEYWHRLKQREGYKIAFSV